jgi:hypothetical protein
MTNQPNRPPAHQPGRQRPEPKKHGGPAPLPDMDHLAGRLGPTRMSLRDLALGLQLGTIQLADYTGRPDDPESFLNQWLDDGQGQEKKGGYDPLKVYTSSTNKHDHRTQIRLNLSHPMLSAIRTIVGIVPQFGSEGAFVRDAILHSLHHWVARLDGFIDEEARRDVTLASAHAILLSMQDDVDNRRLIMDGVDQLIEDSMRDGDVARVEQTCDIYEVIADNAPDGVATKMRERIGMARRWVADERRAATVRAAKERAEKMRREKDEQRWMEREAAGDAGGAAEDWHDE